MKTFTISAASPHATARTTSSVTLTAQARKIGVIMAQTGLDYAGALAFLEGEKAVREEKKAARLAALVDLPEADLASLREVFDHYLAAEHGNKMKAAAAVALELHFAGNPAAIFKAAESGKATAALAAALSPSA